MPVDRIQRGAAGQCHKLSLASVWSHKFPSKLKVEREQYFPLIMVLEYIILHSAVEQEQFEENGMAKIENVQNEA